MSLLDQLLQPQCWERFYFYKSSLTASAGQAEELRQFIDREAYVPPAGAILRGEPFPLPRRYVLSKMQSGRKRTVYTYPAAENTVLKLLTYLMLRKYDSLFSRNLYSFRPGRTAKDAIRSLTHLHGVQTMFAYKADISNYFNSVPLSQLLPMLEDALKDDPRLFVFLRSLLEEPYVLDGAARITEEKGIMAGTPLSAFYANLYLSVLDRWFADQGIPYARYSDDIIVLAPTEALRDHYAEIIRRFLTARGLSLNPEKECLCSPEDGWSFLGFYYRNGAIDIAPASVTKLKRKMRRKTRALRRWADRNHLSGEKAAAAFIRIFNRKLLEQSADRDLTWSRWFFPVINTTESLRVIDRYAQDCLRCLLSGKRTKGRYKIRYDELKKLGYKSLVHEYYDIQKNFSENV
ncbi:MAG: group II intron reverse transcriptase domain-containing protein [Oscillospiraceae bacterium]|nr:group II intron reverse transcriptase domain-containing protein [Oscillospiraceae bacterium]